VVPLRVVPSGLDSRKAWQSSLTAGSSCRRQAAVVLRRATSHSSGLVASAAKKMRSASAARLCVTCNADDVTEAAQNGVTLAKDAFGDTITIYPSLESLPAVTYLDNNGFVTPALPERYAASVFAVLDDKKNVLYIGFSKDVRNTLRRLLARRTNLCCYYKLFNFEAVDPEGLMACRKQWFKELGMRCVDRCSSVYELHPAGTHCCEMVHRGDACRERGRCAAHAVGAATEGRGYF